MRWTRRHFLYSLGMAGLASATVWPSIRKTAPIVNTNPLVIDDASHLNPTKISRKVKVIKIEDLSTAIQGVSRHRTTAIAAGARHSMGAQSIPSSEGVSVEWNSQSISIDSKDQTYCVSAGLRWNRILPELNKQGLSVQVMQSNNDFSVGGTLSVNAHGWAVPYGPFGCSVESFRIMMADGSVLNCSRRENRELFSLAIGGYGLFGVIIDVCLKAVPNRLLAASQRQIDADHIGPAFQNMVASGASEAVMAYGRLSVSRNEFLSAGLLTFFKAVPADQLPELQDMSVTDALAGIIFNAQSHSESGKSFRWYVEKKLAGHIQNNVTRNALLNYPASLFSGVGPHETDILHEYFLSPEKFGKFLAQCRDIIPRHKADLLNVTIRYVERDDVSFLVYATSPAISAVMLFRQMKSVAGEGDMRSLTQALIDAAIDCGGRYYLPYRTHATREQFYKCYPSAERFFRLKHKYDPALAFRNRFFDLYS